MFSQRFSRSTAIRRNSFGYRPFLLLATCSSFPCKVCHFRLSQHRGSVQPDIFLYSHSSSVDSYTVLIGPGYCDTKESMVSSVTPSTVACATKILSKGSL